MSASSPHSIPELLENITQGLVPGSSAEERLLASVSIGLFGEKLEDLRREVVERTNLSRAHCSERIDAEVRAGRLEEQHEADAELLAEADAQATRYEATISRLEEQHEALSELERKSFGWAKHWEAEAERLKEQLQTAQQEHAELVAKGGDLFVNLAVLGREKNELKEQLETLREALGWITRWSENEVVAMHAQRALDEVQRGSAGLSGSEVRGWTPAPAVSSPAGSHPAFLERKVGGYPPVMDDLLEEPDPAISQDVSERGRGSSSEVAPSGSVGRDRTLPPRSETSAAAATGDPHVNDALLCACNRKEQLVCPCGAVHYQDDAPANSLHPDEAEALEPGETLHYTDCALPHDHAGDCAAASEPEAKKLADQMWNRHVSNQEDSP